MSVDYTIHKPATLFKLKVTLRKAKSLRALRNYVHISLRQNKRVTGTYGLIYLQSNNVLIQSQSSWSEN